LQFLKELNRNRLRKNIPLKTLFATARVSLRDWHAWTKVLLPGERRAAPNEVKRKRLFDALEKLPARDSLRVGRPCGKGVVK